MNVNNPDFSVLLQEVEKTGGFLPNTGQVVIEGSPGDWTLVSYDGVAVPQDPGLGTELFVDFRNLIEAPQFAGYDIYEALLTGNSATIDAAIQTGVSQVDTALSQFPVEVFDQTSSPHSAGACDAPACVASLADCYRRQYFPPGRQSAWADDGSIVLDFIRHGESGDMTAINTMVPGPDLTAPESSRPLTLAMALKHSGIDEIWASTMVRSQETAAPLADELGIVD